MNYLNIILENCESHRINGDDVLRLIVHKKKKIFFGKGAYKCKKCEITLSKAADVDYMPFGVLRFPNTIFKNIKGNTIESIEIGDDKDDICLIHVPFKYMDGQNQYQNTVLDKENNLHIILGNK